MRATLLFSGIAAVAASGYTGPAIYWASSPVRPGETVVLTGEGLEGTQTVRFRAAGKTQFEVKPHTVTPGCVMAEIPAGTDAEDLLCEAGGKETFSNPLPVNMPEVWWWLGDQGERVTPGGGLRLFGQSLGERAEAKLVANGKDVPLVRGGAKPDDSAWPVAEKDCLAEKIWDARFLVPAETPEGEWPLSVRLPGKAWHDAGKVAVKKPAPWPETTIDFAAMPGENNDERIANAFAVIKAAGGGSVVFPRGRFGFQAPIEVPDKTVLRGAGMAMTSLYWTFRDEQDVPGPLVAGQTFGIEDLALCAWRNKGVVKSKDSDGFFLRRVRIRASGFFRMGNPGEKDFRKSGHDTPIVEQGNAVWVCGRNFEIRDCDIYTSGRGIFCFRASCGCITGNRVEYGVNSYYLESVERVAFEGNAFAGAGLSATGNSIPSTNQGRTTHIWISRNRFRRAFGQDMELLTTDCAGIAYTGTVASVTGDQLTLAENPDIVDYQESWLRTHGHGAGHGDTNWVGGLVSVLTGKGAGQWRLVTEPSTGKTWRVDRPWITPPDSSSLVGICSMMGRMLIIDNLFEDGGPVQLYKAGTGTIFAGNRMARTSGICVLGGSVFGKGYGPSWYCQLFDNAVLEGNLWGPETGGISIYTGAPAGSPPVAMCRGMVLRRNRLASNASIWIEGGSNGSYTADSLIENCTVENNDVGICVDDGCRTIVLRHNNFQEVGQPVQHRPR